MKRSIASWHGLEGWLALFGYMAIVGLAVSVPGVLQDWINKTINEMISWIALTYLLLLFFLITPYRIWQENQDKIYGLSDLTNYECAINDLSALFDEGNNTVFNPPIMAGGEYPAWCARRNDWQKRVENHLEQYFGLQEKNLFRNLVIVYILPLSGYSPQYIHERRQVAKQLEILRDAIVRYSDRVQRSRAENT